MGLTYFEGGDYVAITYASGCIACRSIKREGENGIFSFGEDDWNRYDLCETCATEMGATLGMATKKNADELRANNRRLGTDLKTAKKEIENLRTLVTQFFSPEEAAAGALDG